MKTIPALLLATALAFGGGQDASALSEEEQTHLRQVLSEAGNSPVEFTRALEGHLQKYPKSNRKPEIERALAKSAIESRDMKRIVLYGERMLATSSADDPMLLEQVAQALVVRETKEDAQKASAHAARLVQVLKKQQEAKQGSPRDQARQKEAVDEGLARAWQIWALALETLGETARAAELARMSFDLIPSASASRIAGRLYEKAGQKQEAIAAWACAFAIDDSERPADRRKMVSLYKAAKGTEAGAGDEILKAFDRIAEIEKRREAEIQSIDPNHGLEKPLDFTLTGLKGDQLDLKSLRGRVVVFDFWATWCGPCRQQYPLYQQVQERFKKNPKVVFLALNTDEERAAVKPFVESLKWDKSVYFDEGLSSLLKVSSIPTTMVFNGKGDLVSRMNGFLPDRFVDMLSERISQALNE